MHGIFKICNASGYIDNYGFKILGRKIGGMAQSIRVLVAFPEALVQFLASTTQFTTVPGSSSRMSVAYI